MAKLIDNTLMLSNRFVVENMRSSRKELKLATNVSEVSGIKNYIFTEGMGIVRLHGRITASAQIDSDTKILDFSTPAFANFRLSSGSSPQTILPVMDVSGTLTPIICEVRQDGVYTNTLVPSGGTIHLNGLSYINDYIVG